MFVCLSISGVSVVEMKQEVVSTVSQCGFDSFIMNVATQCVVLFLPGFVSIVTPLFVTNIVICAISGKHRR